MEVIPPDEFLAMMNYRAYPYLGKSDDELFDFMKPKSQGMSVYDVFKEQKATIPSSSRRMEEVLRPKSKGMSVYDVFSGPKAVVPGSPEKSRDFLDFFRPAQKRTEQSLAPVGGDPFSAASSFRGDGDPFAAAASRAPYPRMRERAGMPALSGPGCESCKMSSVLGNPALWLIAGVGVLIALEANGITKLSSNA